MFGLIIIVLIFMTIIAMLVVCGVGIYKSDVSAELKAILLTSLGILCSILIIIISPLAVAIISNLTF